MIGHFYITAFDSRCIQWRENPASDLVAVPLPTGWFTPNEEVTGLIIELLYRYLAGSDAGEIAYPEEAKFGFAPLCLLGASPCPRSLAHISKSLWLGS